MKELEEIKARADAATPEPWVADTHVRGDCVVWGPDGQFLMNQQGAPHWVPDAEGRPRMVSYDVDRRDCEFIAHARRDVPRLLAALDAIAALHVPIMEDGEPVGCSMCDWEHPSYAYGKAWPCPTLDAITTALEGTA